MCNAPRRPTRSRRRTVSGLASSIPTRTPTTHEAAEQFKKIAQAYQVLSDDDQRARYDRYGEAGVGGNGGGGPTADDLFGGGLGDIFETFFGGGGSPFGGGRQRGPSGPPRGQDIEVVADITFEQSVFGDQVDVSLKLPVTCEDCSGSGAAEGTSPVTCCGLWWQRSDPAGAPEPARPDGDGEPVHPMRWSRPGHHVTRAARAGARVGSPSTRRTRSTFPPASTPARRCA